MRQLDFFEESKQVEYKSRHVAKLVNSGKLIYSGPKNDLTNECMCWYSSDDSNARDCAVVMDNKQFFRMQKEGEIVFIKTDIKGRI